MMTGSWCLTEIAKSKKPTSSNRAASLSADCTSAPAGSASYMGRSRWSSEPAFTPMRIEVPWSVAARAMSAILSSNALMLPGLTRTFAQPASMAAKT